jgi:hypothetical protein
MMFMYVAAVVLSANAVVLGLMTLYLPRVLRRLRERFDLHVVQDEEKFRHIGERLRRHDVEIDRVLRLRRWDSTNESTSNFDGAKQMWSSGNGDT